MEWLLIGFLVATFVSLSTLTIALIWERMNQKREREMQALHHLITMQKDAEREAQSKAFKALKTAESRWWKTL